MLESSTRSLNEHRPEKVGKHAMSYHYKSRTCYTFGPVSSIPDVLYSCVMKPLPHEIIDEVYPAAEPVAWTPPELPQILLPYEA